MLWVDGNKKGEQMTTEILRFLWAVAPSIFVGVVLGYHSRKQEKKNKIIEERAELRKKESILLLKMTFANGKLAHASATALKNGKMNGELAEAEKTYKKAIASYNEFVNETHIDFIKED